MGIFLCQKKSKSKYILPFKSNSQPFYSNRWHNKMHLQMQIQVQKQTFVQLELHSEHFTNIPKQKWSQLLASVWAALVLRAPGEFGLN